MLCPDSVGILQITGVLMVYTVCLKSKCTDFPMDELEM
jgi:hypothetical protein